MPELGTNVEALAGGSRKRRPPCLNLHGREEGSSFEDHVECFERVQSVLASGGDVGANSGEGLASFETSETAGDFRLDLRHPDIAFGEIVVERTAGVVEEAEDLIVVDTESFGKVECLSAAPEISFAGILAERPLEGLRIGSLHEEDVSGRDAVEPFRPGLVIKLLRLLEGGEHVCGPSLPLMKIAEALELPHEMGAARLVEAAEILEIDLPEVMDGDALESGDDAERVEALLAPFSMEDLQGQAFRPGGVKPVELAFDPHAGLIEMDDAGGDEPLADSLLPGAEKPVASEEHLDHRPCGDADAKDGLHELNTSCNRDHLIACKVSHEGVDARPILDGSRHTFWKFRARPHAAMRADFDFDPVFDDLDGLRLRDVNDLPPLYDMSAFSVQKKSAVDADVRAVENHVAGSRAHGERGAVVSRLAAGLFTGAGAQATVFCRRLPVAIGRGRLGAVRAARLQAGLKLGYLPKQCGDLLSLGVDCRYGIIKRHEARIASPRKSTSPKKEKASNSMH